uniref:Uncharacterized protein n=1 Tax=Ascaris lumbricoides TaxID=6252 RepID=A0A0M3HLL8_ASCLU
MEVVQKLSNIAPTHGVIPEQNVEQASTNVNFRFISGFEEWQSRFS